MLAPLWLPQAYGGEQKELVPGLDSVAPNNLLQDVC